MTQTALETDCAFLENELLDVVRLFESRPLSVRHSFRFEGGRFFNDFEVDGESRRFCEEARPADEIEYKRFERRFAKLGLYRILSEKYGERMPWGALTGIRPTKLAYTEKEAGGISSRSLKRWGSGKKTSRWWPDVLKAQEGIYEKRDGNSDLFVSLPFCPTKCSYCSFITAPVDKTRAFLPRLSRLPGKGAFGLRGAHRKPARVYIGGGRAGPGTRELERVLKGVEKNPGKTGASIRWRRGGRTCLRRKSCAF